MLGYDEDRQSDGTDVDGVVSYIGVLFFFQAEDGIRDIGVTGVQTCALPILGGEAPPVAFEDVRRGQRPVDRVEGLEVGGDRERHDAARRDVATGAREEAGAIGRSEERRVGKECRSRWSPYP